MAVFAGTAVWVLSSLLYSSCGLNGSDQPAAGHERTANVCTDRQMVVFQENGREANLALVSTGRPPYFSTPRGEFRVQYRLRNPMSSTYLVRMPYWVCIEPSGAYGFHQANGIAESRLGEPLSHGCIRLGRFTAKWVYSWMPNGAGVTIH